MVLHLSDSNSQTLHAEDSAGGTAMTIHMAKWGFSNVMDRPAKFVPLPANIVDAMVAKNAFVY
jgi:hypothetical protein